MPTAIKLCGLSRPAEVDAALAARADHVGFVFFPPSPRNIDVGMAAALTARTGGGVGRVGVFVDPDDALLGEAVAAGRLTAIQLHGQESPARTAELRARFALPVWKAVAVAGRSDLAAGAAYVGAADLLLLDARPPKGAALPGGMGLRFDWGLLDGWRAPMMWGLSGGLDPANVADAIRTTGAPLVDVSSGIESAPGVKDVDSMAAFCKAARTFSA